MYRIEGFCFFYVNAWELLAKARLIENGGKEAVIFYKKKRGQPRRSLSLRDALERVIPERKDAVRRNVEQIADLRDHATHLLIPELEAVYAGLFRRCLQLCRATSKVVPTSTTRSSNAAAAEPRMGTRAPRAEGHPEAVREGGADVYAGAAGPCSGCGTGGG